MTQFKGNTEPDGYRPNVGIVLFNRRPAGAVGVAKPTRDGWAVSQGGIEDGETLEQAAYRELYEEVGLRPESVELGGTDPKLVALRGALVIYVHVIPVSEGKKQVVSDADAC